ncbi:MAG: YfhO family protein, partial [Candidatus Hydrogenedentes bacterium]|nr:YfhO family protein [Candidatus Hydrogenedentota bacterium]
ALLFCVIYVVIRIVLQRSSTGLAASLAGLAALVAMGLLLAAVQIVPYAEFLPQASATGGDDAPTTLRVADFVVAYLPRFLGRALGIWTAEGVLRHARVIRLLYVGLAQVLLLSVWFSVRSFVAVPQRRRVEALLWTVTLMTGLAMAAGRALDHVPLLRELGAQHLLAANSLALALVAAAAAHEWLLLNAEQCWRAVRRLAVYLPLLLVLGGVAAVAHQHVPRIDAPALWLQAAKSGVLLAGLLVLLAATLLRPSHRLLGYGLAAMTWVSLATAWTPGLRYVDPRLVFPDTPLVQAVRSAGGRLGGSDRLAQWPLAAELIPQVYAPSGVMLRRQEEFVNRLEEDPLLLRHAGAQALLLTREDIQGAFAPVRPMLSIDRVFPSGAVLFSDLDSMPRAWLAYEWVTSIDDTAPDNRLDPSNITPRLPSVEGAGAPPADSSGARGKAEIALASATRVTVSVDTPKPCLLVLSDTFYPGWKAEVDGKEAPIYPVDGMFRGVPVEAGTHQVDFYYVPQSVRIGLYISLIAAGIVLIELRRVFWRAYY